MTDAPTIGPRLTDTIAATAIDRTMSVRVLAEGVGTLEVYAFGDPCGFAYRNARRHCANRFCLSPRWAIMGRVIRKAFRMQVHPGQHAEYVRRHRPIWQELEDALLQHGVRSYSIFIDPHTNDLFGYVECDSETTWSAVVATEVCRRWWRFMREIMPANGDDSPVSRDLHEVFHLEACDRAVRTRFEISESRAQR